jgi:hypothetical protein
MREGKTGIAVSEVSPCEISEAYLASEISETSVEEPRASGECVDDLV